MTHRARRGSPSARTTGRRLVVGDIHGCARTLTALLDGEMKVGHGDQIFFLGDLISKGPDSLGVLEYVTGLPARGVGTVIIRGNHEAAILGSLHGKRSRLRQLLEQTRNEALLDPQRSDQLDPRWRELLERSVYVVRLPDAILVHGGIDMSRAEPFADGELMVHLRSTIYDARVAENRPVIHGHTRAPLSTIIESLVNAADVVPLDNGAVGASSRKPFKVTEYGNLCCLNLDTWTLHVQPNLDVVAAAGAGADEANRPAFSLTIRPSPRTAGLPAVPVSEST